MAALADYISTLAGVYKHSGQPMKYINTDLTKILTTIPAELDAVADVFEAGGTVATRRECTKLITEHYLQSQLDVLAGIARLGRVVEKRMIDKTTILNPLFIEDATIEKVLDALIEDMYGNETVNASDYTVGTVTAGTGNVGTGGCVMNDTLDGVSQPCQRFRAHRRYLNVTSELLIAETMTVVCVSDSYGNVHPNYRGQAFTRLLETNYVQGREQFFIHGRSAPTHRVSSHPQWGSGYGIDTEGSGNGPIFYALNANLGTPETTLILNNGFENWSSANVPTNWTDSDAGAAGTNVFQCTTAADVYIGTSSLEFRGDGATATIRRAQSPTSTQYFVANKRYYFSIWIKGQAATAAGTLTICYTGTGYTASASEKVTFALSAAPTSWTHYGFYLTMPSSIPSDWQLKIEVTGTMTNAKSIFFDDVNIRDVTWHGGLNVAVYNGSTPPVVGDFWRCAITAVGEGVIQNFHKRWFGVQLPSNNAGGETVPDSLAT